jgi:hypothetical protein
MDLTALPNGDQDILGALAERLLACLRDAERVVLVANNPAIEQADFDALTLGPRDVVVSFNACVKWPMLSERWTNVFVHGFNAPDHYFFGLPYAPELQALWHNPQARCFSVLVGVADPMSPVADVSLLRERIPLPALWNYPKARADGKRFVGPTTGFNALVLFDWLRREQGLHYRLLTLGYSNEAGKLWSGHAWDYERAWLAGADVEAIALRKRPWWQRWIKRH